MATVEDITPQQWAEMRMAWETHVTVAALSREYGIHRNFIDARRKQEKWKKPKTAIKRVLSSGRPMASKLPYHNVNRAELVEIVCKAIRIGETIKGACADAGIAQQTLYEWMSKNPDFAASITRARVSFRQAHLKRITKSALEGDWRASKWLLAVQFPDEFSEAKD